MADKITFKLIQWYKKNKRDLPWRDTTDPYKIWISEVILQQTRVKFAKEYYLNFIKKFPNIKNLSEAKEDDVLNLWQGLGYYSRARNLHSTSKIIQKKFDGVFPNTYDEVIKLKGIGKYTCSAILSFAFKKKYSVVDGNVFRFLSRYFSIKKFIDTSEGQRFFYKLTDDLICKKEPDIFNQAIIEFGAIVCKPRGPTCDICIFNKCCSSYKTNTVYKFPLKRKKHVVQSRFFLFILDKKTINLKKIKNGIWKGLYSLPTIELKNEVDFKNVRKNTKQYFFDYPVILNKVSRTITHKLTHQKLFVKFCFSKINSKNLNDYVQINIESYDSFPVPVVIHNFLKNFLSEKKL